MRTMLVSYDLNRPGQGYPGLYEALKAVPRWWHYLDSTWLLKTEENAGELRNRLRALLDAGDELLVVDVTNPEAAWSGFDEPASRWMRDHL